MNKREQDQPRVSGSKRGKRSAFTLIELLVAVAILAILAAIAIPNFLAARTRSKVARVLSDLRTLRTAIEAYAVDFGALPRCSWGGEPFNDVYAGGGAPPEPIYLTLGPWLTTPVAYVARFDLIDPFGEGQGRPAESRLYTYESLRTMRQIIAGGFNASPLARYENGFFENNFGEYALASTGPDGDLPFPETYYRQYDPTNGLVSAGNVWVSRKRSSPAAISWEPPPWQ